MAQLVEQLIRNQQVAGSSPAISSKKRFDLVGPFLLYHTFLPPSIPKARKSHRTMGFSFLEERFSRSAVRNGKGGGYRRANVGKAVTRAE